MRDEAAGREAAGSLCARRYSQLESMGDNNSKVNFEGRVQEIDGALIRVVDVAGRIEAWRCSNDHPLMAEAKLHGVCWAAFRAGVRIPKRGIARR